MGWQSMASIWADAVARTIYLMEQYQPTTFLQQTADRVREYQTS